PPVNARLNRFAPTHKNKQPGPRSRVQASGPGCRGGSLFVFDLVRLAFLPNQNLDALSDFLGPFHWDDGDVLALLDIGEHRGLAVDVAFALAVGRLELGFGRDLELLDLYFALARLAFFLVMDGDFDRAAVLVGVFLHGRDLAVDSMMLLLAFALGSVVGGAVGDNDQREQQGERNTQQAHDGPRMVGKRE